MYRYLLPLAFFSCGARVELPTIDVDPTLRPFLDHYLDIAPSVGRIGALRVLKFGDPGPNYIGICVEFTATSRDNSHSWTEIIIRPDLPDWLLPVVVYHELLHCAHGKEHVADPGAIMYHAPSGDAQYWEVNLDEQLAAAFAEGGI